MKATVLILFFAICHAESRKVYAPINKNANIDFINMESGGVSTQPAAVTPASAPAAPTTKPLPPTAKPAVPPSPTSAPASKPVPPQPPKPAQPAPTPTQIKPVPVNPAPVANPFTTPGPGSVKSLINFYDSHGKASPIRPYSYSQAVKQG